MHYYLIPLMFMLCVWGGLYALVYSPLATFTGETVTIQTGVLFGLSALLGTIGLGMFLQARSRGSTQTRALVSAGLIVASVILGGWQAKKGLALRPSWSRAEALWRSPDGFERVRGARQISALLYAQVTGHAADRQWIVYHPQRSVWPKLKPAHIASLSPVQRALVGEYAEAHLEQCDPALSRQSGSRYWLTFGQMKPKECDASLDQLRALAPEGSPTVDRVWRARLVASVGQATSMSDVLARAEAWGAKAPASLDLDGVVTGAFAAKLKATRAQRKTITGQLQVIEGAVGTLAKHDAAQQRAPGLKRLHEALVQERDRLRRLPAIGQPLSYLHHRLAAARPQRTVVSPQWVAFFDAGFAQPPVLARLGSTSKEAPVLALLSAPPLGAEVTPDTPDALKRALASAQQGAPDSALTGLAHHPERAKGGRGWATVTGDLPPGELASALVWLAGFEGVAAHLDARNARELAGRGYTEAHTRALIAHNKRLVREHYMSQGLYDGVHLPYVLRTSTTHEPSGVRPTGSVYRSYAGATYRSGTTIVIPPRPTPTTRYRRGASPSYRSSTSAPSYRSTSSSYRSRYSASSSRSASRAGGYRSGK